MRSDVPNLICDACGAGWFSAASAFWVGRTCLYDNCDGKLIAGRVLQSVKLRSR